MNTFDMDTFRIILVAILIFFSLGSAAGWLLAQLLKPPAENEAGKKRSPAAEPVPPPSPPAQDLDKIELARAFRERTSGEVFYEIDGKKVQSAGELNETQRSALMAAGKALAGLISAPRPGTGSEQPAPTVSYADEAFPTQTPPLIPVRPGSSLPAPETYIKKPSMNPLEALLRTAQAGQANSGPPKSLAGQIDEILQEKLAVSPLAGQDIRLGDNESLGLEVWVGVNRYDGIDAVPDAQVRDLIRASVAEWQARSMHGPRQ